MSGRMPLGLAGSGAKPPNKVKRPGRYPTVHIGVWREASFLRPTTPEDDNLFDFAIPRLPLSSRDTVSMESKSEFHILSLSNSDARVRDYKKRKAHKKTKSGCLPCRAKRVKVCIFIDVVLNSCRGL